MRKVVDTLSSANKIQGLAILTLYELYYDQKDSGPTVERPQLNTYGEK